MNRINIDTQNLKLSGKGVIIDEFKEWKQDNIKISTQETEFHEIIGVLNNNPDTRIGWISEGKLSIMADFTAHTKDGMVGKSIQEQMEWFLILDLNNKISEFTGSDLVDVNIEETEKLFKKYISGKNFHINTSLDFGSDDLELNSGLLLISIKSNLIYLQSPKSSIRIAKDGIIILNLLKDGLTSVNSEDGIKIIQNGKNVVSLGKDSSIIIDGKEFDPHKIVRKVTNSIEDMMSSLKF